MPHPFNSLCFQKYIAQLCLLIFLVLGCTFSKNEKIAQNKIIITGEAETQNPKQRLFLSNQFGSSLAIVNDKKFQFKLEENKASTLILSIQYFNFPIFAKPGDSIHIKFNEIDLLNEMASPTFSGSRIIENNYFYKLHQLLKYKSTNYQYFYNCNETEFLNKIDSLNYLGKIIITKYKSQPNADIVCEKAMEIFLKYNLAYYVESYHSILKNSFSKDVKGKSERFLSYQKELIIDDSLLLKNNAYCSFLERKLYNNITNQTSLEGKQVKKKMWQDYSVEEQFEFTDITFESKSIKDYLKFKTLYNRIHTTGVILKTDQERFEQTNPSSKYLEVIKHEFSQMPETLRESTVLPNYTFLDKDEIEFIGISLDKEFEKEKWKDLINKRKFEGIQLIAKNAFQSEICKDLKVNGIPRFLIIGRDGELIQSHAPRPRQVEIQKILTDLIRKP